MATTYTLISSVTVGSGGAANIEFTSIPATYTDLVIKLSAKVVYNNPLSRLELRFNNSNSNYSNRLLYNYLGSAGSTTSTSGITFFYANGSDTAVNNVWASSDIYIPNYASSNNKSVSVDTTNEINGTDIIQGISAGLWSDSSAITSIKLTDANATDFTQYSTAYIYGIKNS